jgi:DNA-binding transcriptional LysR family regulator
MALTTSEITLLLAVSEPTTFTAVALELGISQSAVSKAIQALEDRFGVELVTRGRFGCAPSEKLKRLRPGLRRSEYMLESLENELRSPDSALSGKIRIVGFRSATTLLLPPAVSKFIERHPEVDISISTIREVGTAIVDQVLNGRADFGITTARPPASLPSVNLGFDCYMLIRKVQRGKLRESQKSGSHERLILWKENCSECVPGILSAQGLVVKRVLRVEDDETVLKMVAQGSGFTVMPQLAAGPLSDGFQIEVLNEYKRYIWLFGHPVAWSSAVGRILRRGIVSSSHRLLTQ